jgi:hypothetical protein
LRTIAATAAAWLIDDAQDVVCDWILTISRISAAGPAA